MPSECTQDAQRREAEEKHLRVRRPEQCAKKTATNGRAIQHSRPYPAPMQHHERHAHSAPIANVTPQVSPQKRNIKSIQGHTTDQRNKISPHASHNKSKTHQIVQAYGYHTNCESEQSLQTQHGI